jgi:hypothetical protein
MGRRTDDKTSTVVLFSFNVNRKPQTHSINTNTINKKNVMGRQQGYNQYQVMNVDGCTLKEETTVSDYCTVIPSQATRSAIDRKGNVKMTKTMSSIMRNVLRDSSIMFAILFSLSWTQVQQCRAFSTTPVPAATMRTHQTPSVETFHPERQGPALSFFTTITTTTTTTTTLSASYGNPNERGGGSFPYQEWYDDPRINVHNLLTQRSVQSFMFLCESVRDPHSPKWIEDFLRSHNQLEYHGTGLGYCTGDANFDGSWDHPLVLMMNQPKDVVVVSAKRRGRYVHRSRMNWGKWFGLFCCVV